MLEVTYLPSFDQHSSAEALSATLNAVTRQQLLYTPWKEFSERPIVSFAMAHGEGAIFLKYFIEEKTLRSTYLNPNDPVYKDSCVEFFISFEGEELYYNFEWNCAGSCLAGFGKGKDRALLPAADILKIKHYSQIRSSSSGPLAGITGTADSIQWEITLIIPADVFIHHRLRTFSNMKGRGNFFKCGDELPQPHYLAWTQIVSPAPEFHLQEYFADIVFYPES
jgi:hypothetical protein